MMRWSDGLISSREVNRHFCRSEVICIWFEIESSNKPTLSRRSVFVVYCRFGSHAATTGIFGVCLAADRGTVEYQQELVAPTDSSLFVLGLYSFYFLSFNTQDKHFVSVWYLFPFRLGGVMISLIVAEDGHHSSWFDWRHTRSSWASSVDQISFLCMLHSLKWLASFDDLQWLQSNVRLMKYQLCMR